MNDYIIVQICLILCVMAIVISGVIYCMSYERQIKALAELNENHKEAASKNTLPF